jgi:ATP-dependent Lon protease
LHHDKREIAKRHIIPKQLREHGLDVKRVSFTDAAIDKIIADYTREAGVRNLEREIASASRKIAKDIVLSKGRKGGKAEKGGKGAKDGKEAKGGKRAAEKSVVVDPERVEKYLGVARFRSRLRRTEARVGSVTGLAWTSVGGDILHVDVSVMPGAEKLTLTGQLGEVMKESAQAALSYLRSQARSFGLKETMSKGREIHVHVPEGSIPKDGPSAGITMAMAMYSALSGRPARSDVAMTGEITLRGEVLAIGGLNEKLLAAQRSGIRKVLIPDENKKELTEIPEKVKEGLTIVPISKIEEALPHVFPKAGEKG